MNHVKEVKILPRTVKNGDLPAAMNPDCQSPAEREFRLELSHKLRTPLNVIIGFTELVARRPGTAKDPDIQHILKSAREMLEIMNRELGDPNIVSMNAPNLVHPVSCDVLYIEDDLVNYTLVERILELRPALKLLHAPNGETGLDLAQIHRPKLILLDLNLPDMHGADVLAKLQANPTTAELPVVVLSADATPSQIERLLTAGAKNYLTKPFDIDPFLAVVDETVAKSSRS